MTTIKLKNGSGAPTAGDLAQGEPALDLTNKRLYTEDSGGTVIEVGTNPGASGAVTLNYSGSAKLATTSSGIDVTGTAVTDGLTVAGTAQFDDYGGTTGKGRIQFGNSGQQFIEGLDTGNGGSGAYLKFGYASTDVMSITSSGIDVTGTVTADGLTVDAALATINAPSNNADLVLTENGTNTDARIRNSNGILEIDADLNNEFGNSSMMFAVDGTDRLKIDNNGDISFYEDTGTTAKLFWDASAESLGIGTTSPASGLHVVKGTADVLRLERDATNDWRFQLTTGALAFRDATNDTEAMRIGSDGNVAIGTTSTSSIRLNSVTPTANHIAAQIENTNTADSFGLVVKGGNDANDYAADFRKRDNTNIMRLRGDGNVGIGESSPDAALHVKTSTNTPLLLESTIASGGYAEFQLGASGATIGYLGSAGGIVTSGAVADLAVRSQANLTFATGGSTERMRLDSSGNLLVGCTDVPSASVGGAGFDLNTNARAVLKLATTSTGNQGLAEFFNPNGQVGGIVTNGSATAYNTSSDQRLKENIVDAPSASDDIDAIQVRSFDWKADGSHQKYGMVAQELQSVAPEAVSGDADSDDMMGVDYSKLVPMLVKEIQSLRARVAQLEGAN